MVHLSRAKVLSCLFFFCTLSSLPSSSFGLTLSKLLDDPTSLAVNWFRGSVMPHSGPPPDLWFSLPGMVPLASDPPNFSSKMPASANRYSNNQPQNNHHRQQLSSWQLSPGSGQALTNSKSATLADINFPKSGSNRDAALISTKVVSKRNPQQPSSSSDGNRYMAANFDPFSRVDLENFFNDSPPGAEGALPVNSASVINTADGKERSNAVNGQQMDMSDILKIDQLENMFDMDMQF